MIRFFQGAVLALMLVPSAATSQDFDAGVAAANAGDFATAAREWKPLAEQGDAAAQFNLGLMYENGRGVPQDNAEALKWYRLAAAQGHLKAQITLGMRSEQGNGVPQDVAEAVRWYLLAAKQGDAMAQSKLGLMYAGGGDIPQDFGTAHMWLNLAAANGDTMAAEMRDLTSPMMTPADLAEAQRRARVCLASNYQDCD